MAVVFTSDINLDRQLPSGDAASSSRIPGVALYCGQEWRSRLFWRLQVYGWLLAGGLSTFFIALGPFRLDHALILGLARNLFGFTVTLGMRYVFRHLRQTSSNVWLRTLFVLLLSGVASLLDGLVMLAVGSTINVEMHSIPLSQLVVATTFMRWVLYLLWALLYFGINYWLDAQQEQIRAIQRDAEMRTNELRLLRAQVNPHFLFNALTSIQAVAGDRERAMPLIQAFGDYLRFSLEGRRDMLPLGVELDALENYLRVEKIRFTNKLEYIVDASDSARKVTAPIALVQPLLENAVKFAQKSGIWPVCISIRAACEADQLRVTVTNSGQWVEFDESSSTGIGLENLRRRLSLIYGPQAQLSIDSGDDVVTATVVIPVQAKL